MLLLAVTLQIVCTIILLRHVCSEKGTATR